MGLEGWLDEFPCSYFVSPPYSSSGSIAPRAQVMVPRNIWALSHLCDSFPGRVISSELAGSSSFPRSSLPKAHIPAKTARAGLWLGFSLFLLCLSVKWVGVLGQGGMNSLTEKQDPACSKYQSQTQQSSPVWKSQGVPGLLL